MGKIIKVYDNGQVYEIDSDLIYVPIFARKYVKKRIDEILPPRLEFQFMEKEDKHEDENGKEKQVSTND